MKFATDGLGFVSVVNTKRKVKCVSSLVFVCIMHRAQFLPCVKWQTARCTMLGPPAISVRNRHTPCGKTQNVEQPYVTFKRYVVQSEAKLWDKHEQRKRN